MRHRVRFAIAGAITVAVCTAGAWWVGSREVHRTNLSRDLVVAILNGDAGDCERLLKAGADPNVHNDFIAEHLSPWIGFARVVRRALGRPSSPVRGRLAISLAIQSGRTDIYKLLIKYHQNPHEADFYGRTALWTAAEVGRPDMVKVELARGAEVDHRDNLGRTPVRIAAVNRHLDVLQALADAGGRIDLIDAAYANDAALVRSAIASGNTALTQESGRTALSIACSYNNLNAVVFLLQHGADVQAADADGYTPLMWAAGSASKEILALLLGRGADVRAKDGERRTALHWVSSNEVEGHLALYRLLVAYHAPVDQRDLQGRTALMQEATRRSAAGAAFLIQRGADPVTKDRSGNSARAIAAMCGNRELVRLIDSTRSRSALADRR